MAEPEHVLHSIEREAREGVVDVGGGSELRTEASVEHHHCVTGDLLSHAVLIGHDVIPGHLTIVSDFLFFFFYIFSSDEK